MHEGIKHFRRDVGCIRITEQFNIEILRRVVLHGFLVAHIELLAIACHETKQSCFDKIGRVRWQGSLSFSGVLWLLAASHNATNHVIVGRLLEVCQVKLLEVVAHIRTCSGFLTVVSSSNFGKSVPLKVSNLIAGFLGSIMFVILFNKEPVTC